MSYPYIIQGKNVVIVIDNAPHTINPQHISYNKILDAIKTSQWDLVKELVEPRKVILKFAAGNVKIEGEQLFWNGELLHSALAIKIIDMFREGFTIEPMVNFMINLMENPSKQAVNELYSFIEKGKMPITSDGYFLAYKKVRNDYMDIYTGKIDNHVGQKPSMLRNKVDDNRTNTCSEGLHFCSESYLPHYGGGTGKDRVMIVKINPRDVVSIPADYNDAKGRTCLYEVIGELGVSQVPASAFTSAVQDNAAVSTPEEYNHTHHNS